MILNESEKAVIWALSLNASKSSEEVAQEIGLASTTVRRIRAKLEERQVYLVSPFIDIYRLGFVHYSMYFSLDIPSTVKREKFLEALIRSERIPWLVEIGGAFQFTMSIVARELHDVIRFLDALTEKYGAAFRDKSISLCTRVIQYPYKFLAPKNARLTDLQWGIGNSREEITELDHRILRQMTKTPRSKQSELAALLDIPPMTLSYRLERLRNVGILHPLLTWLNGEQVGMKPFYLLLSTRGLSQNGTRILHAFCRKHPNIFFLTENFGSYDYEVGIFATDFHEVSQVSSHIRQLLPDLISRIEMLPIISFMKIENYPFQNYETVKEK